MSLFDIVDQDRVNRAVLTIGLALELDFREHGRFPPTLAELVAAGYLKSVPLDPFGKGEPMHYRLDGPSTDHAVLWSVGLEAVNQAGTLPTAKTDSHESPNTVFEIQAVRKSRS